MARTERHTCTCTHFKYISNTDTRMHAHTCESIDSKNCLNRTLTLHPPYMGQHTCNTIVAIVRFIRAATEIAPCAMSPALSTPSLTNAQVLFILLYASFSSISLPHTNARTRINVKRQKTDTCVLDCATLHHLGAKASASCTDVRAGVDMQGPPKHCTERASTCRI